MRKKKHAAGKLLPARFHSIFHIALPVLAGLFFFAATGSVFAAENAVSLGTSAATGKDAGAVIAKDPETGTRVMRTPEPRPQQEQQGPQTVIVTPEVFPDRPGRLPRGRQSGK